MTLPTFAELAGDTEPRLVEASRLFRAVPSMRERGAEGAKLALLGATDAAAREAVLRWLEAHITRGLAVAEMVEGPRADASDTDAWAHGAADAVLGDELPAYLDCSPMARDPDWPPVGKVAMACCDPTMRGEATRLLRDMWWRAMQTEQIEARKKPGAFLASVGITAAHVAHIESEGGASCLEGLRLVANDTDEPTTIDTEQGTLTLPAGASVVLPGETVPAEPLTIEQAIAAMEDEYRAAVREARTDAEFDARMAPVRENYRRAVLAAGDAFVVRDSVTGEDVAAYPVARETDGPPGLLAPPPVGAATSSRWPPGLPIVGALAPAGTYTAALPPREHPPMPRRNGPQPPLPGTARRRPVDAKEIADAIKALGAASVAAADGLHTSLGVSHSTWNNWLAGRNVPRLDVHKARVLSAEIARVIAELERVDEVLRQVVQ